MRPSVQTQLPSILVVDSELARAAAYELRDEMFADRVLCVIFEFSGVRGT